NGKPDCTIDPSIAAPDTAASKTLVASLPTVGGLPANVKTLRVGIFGSDNANPIPDGPLYTCKFTIAAGPTGTIALTNILGASDPNAMPVNVSGTNGTITVGGGLTPVPTNTSPPPTNTSAPPTNTSPPPPTNTPGAGGAAVNLGSTSGNPGDTVTLG